jgi:SAM-dependent methyltransferase
MLRKIFKKEYAEAYDYLYKNKDYEKECDFVESVFRRFSSNVKRILDLGCGTGGHSLILSKRGYQVIGVDRSKEMLDMAKRKADKANLSTKFIESDIRNINLREKFDAVISMFAVMSYQTTNEAISEVCKVAREHLVPEGVFLFDCWNGLAVLTGKPAVCIKEVRANDKEKIIRFTEPVVNILSHTVETKFRVWKIQEGSLINETDESHMMRFLFPQEIKYFLEVAGFKKIAFCPFLKLGETLTDNDWNMTVIAMLKARENAG